MRTWEKSITLARRLYAGLSILLVLLIVSSFLIEQWARSIALDALERTKAAEEAQTSAISIKLHMVTMSDGMRGFLLDQTVRAEMDRKLAADAALVAEVDQLKERFSDGLVAASA